MDAIENMEKCLLLVLATSYYGPNHFINYIISCIPEHRNLVFKNIQEHCHQLKNIQGYLNKISAITL